MVSMTATIDGAASKAFQEALKVYADSLGSAISTAPRRAAIQMCKSFRAGTRLAPKFARSSEYTATKSDADPKHKWLTLNDGRKLRRWKLTRPPRGKEYDVYAESKSDLRKNRLKLVRRGLARQSWGWVMHNIFNGAAPDAPWKRRKNDRRNPKDATRESTSRAQAGAVLSSGYARICNRIDYVKDALKISVDDAINKTTNWMIGPIIKRRLRAGGVSPDDIKASARQAIDDFKRQFGS